MYDGYPCTNGLEVMNGYESVDGCESMNEYECMNVELVTLLSRSTTRAALRSAPIQILVNL